MSTSKAADKIRSLAPVSASRLVAACKAVAEPLRLEVIQVLGNDTFGVQELARIFDMPQPGMSHHLKILARAELVQTRRQGNSIFYRRALQRSDDELAGFLTSLHLTADALPLRDEVKAKIALVHGERAEQSRAFFARNAGKFSENQAQLCEIEHYLPNLRELLDMMELPSASTVLEVGPGAGDLLRELARRYENVIALDNSEEMLSLTRKSIGSAQRDRVTFVNASLEDYDGTDGSLDAVVLNMVLHHLPSPRQAFYRIRELLRSRGRLLIADLGPHDQEWVRDSCGDVWLGFDPQELRDWALSAGFSEPQSLYLGLKNGFQIQIQSFRASHEAAFHSSKGR
ncbi:MAG: hypothetical protein RL011_1763 [Pseudomonadota bacterium]